MPRFDGTGPGGRGPMSGRGLGPCGRGLAFRRGFGRGFGWRNWQRPITNEEEKKMLEDEVKVLEQELISIKKRVEELKK